MSHAADAPEVTVRYRPGPPEHYVARLGTTGWSKGWGWTEQDALASLARVVLDDPSSVVPRAVTRDVSGVAAWLASTGAVTTLDE